MDDKRRDNAWMVVIQLAGGGPDGVTTILVDPPRPERGTQWQLCPLSVMSRAVRDVVVTVVGLATPGCALHRDSVRSRGASAHPP